MLRTLRARLVTAFATAQFEATFRSRLVVEVGDGDAREALAERALDAGHVAFFGG
jgi:hypothetical protein